jgi:Spy/CpxP family protein refolding chaperone
MKKFWKCLLLGGLTLSLLGTAALAQPRGPGGPGGPGGPPSEEMRAKMHEKVRAMRMEKIVELLKPDAATLAKLKDVADRFDTQEFAARKEMPKARKELMEQLDAAKPDEKVIAKLTDQLLTGRAAMHKNEEDRAAALRKILPPAQFAELFLAWPEINREVRDDIRKAMHKSKGGKRFGPGGRGHGGPDGPGGPHGPGGPGGPDDEM